MGILEVHENTKVAFLQEAGCTRLIRWREGNGRRRKDSKGVRRTAWREAIVGKARQNRADLQKHYSILVPYVKDYFGMGSIAREARARDLAQEFLFQRFASDEERDLDMRM
jgi:hypothetical protein